MLSWLIDDLWLLILVAVVVVAPGRVMVLG